MEANADQTVFTSSSSWLPGKAACDRAIPIGIDDRHPDVY